MRITGDTILQSALEAVTNERATGSDATEDLDTISRRSAHVIDSANLSPNLLGQRTAPCDVTVEAGTDRFTWGLVSVSSRGATMPADPVDPQARPVHELTAVDGDRSPGLYSWDGSEWVGPRLNHVQLHPPSEVDYWTVVREGYEYRVTPNGRLTQLYQWLNRSFLGVGGWPQMLYWQRNLNDAGLQTFEFAPATVERMVFRVYAKAPALADVKRGESYELPQGVAAYLIALLAIDACQPFGFQPTPAMFSALKMAERGIRKIPQPPAARAVSPDWLDLDGRGGHYGHHREVW